MSNADATYAQVNQIISNATTLATDKISESDGYLNTAMNAAQSYDLASLSILVASPDLPTIPTTDIASDFEAIYTNAKNTMWSDIDNRVQGYMNTWMGQFVPKMDAQIQPLSDSWLEGVLGGNILGIPKAVENQIWDRGRARENQDAVRLEQEAIDGYAARGFAMPPGALNAKLMLIQTENSLKSATYNREVAIKQAELTIDLSKTAIQITTQLRLGVAQAFGEFIRAALAIPEEAMQNGTNVIASHEALWRTIDAYIRGRVAVSNIELQHNITQAEVDTKAADIVITNAQTRYRTIADTAVAAARTVADIASSAIHSQQTLATVEFETSEQA